MVWNWTWDTLLYLVKLSSLLLGHYLHIEASVMLPGHKARLLSSSLRGSRETQCLQFYYHMYGSGIGQLSVHLQTGQENQDKLLWSSHGEQGISWLRASVNYQYDQQHQVSCMKLHYKINIHSASFSLIYYIYLSTYLDCVWSH